jgi:hypothetical protein
MSYSYPFKAQGVRSATSRICCECRRAIPSGELHEYAWGICEGESFHERTCAECYEIREDLRSDMIDNGLYQDEIAEDLAFGGLRDALYEWCQAC